MFLSTRWGKPISEIESMPVNEFRRHFVFWENHKWGMTDDHLAFNGGQHLSERTGGKPPAIYDLKQYVASHSAKKVHRIQPVSVIRKSLGGLIGAIKALGKQ
jgi:hypothetical protein